MAIWRPIALLPNLFLKDAVDGAFAAIVPQVDPRVLEAAKEQPRLLEFMTRFTDAFGKTLHPSVLLVKEEAPASYFDVSAVAGLRDAVAASFVISGRAKWVRYESANAHPLWAEIFAIYPWTLDIHGNELIIRTPAISGNRDVHLFRGQGLPGIPTSVVSSSMADRPLLDALLSRWEKRFGIADPDWSDRALFRSLNMAYHALMMPAGLEMTFYDAGRLVCLWVSAFEILAHKGKSRVGQHQVMDSLDRVSWFVPESRDMVEIYGKQRCRASKLMDQIYSVRNDFLHGNPVEPEKLYSGETSFFQVASSLYRMALTEFLPLNSGVKSGPIEEGNEWLEELKKNIEIRQAQEHCEHALLAAKL